MKSASGKLSFVERSRTRPMKQRGTRVPGSGRWSEGAKVSL